MFDPTPIPYEPVSGLDITAVSLAGDLRRFRSLAPNHSTELLNLQQGDWVIHNDSPFILCLVARFANYSSNIRTLRPSEFWSFNWPGNHYKLTATLLTSAQVFNLWHINTDTYLQRALTLNLTKWEYLFYQYMIAARTSCRRITEGKSQTPDFTIVVSDGVVPVELKEFSRNEQERNEARLLSSQGNNKGATVEIGQRLAKAANSARSQLRSYLEQHGDGPAILAVIDPCRLRHADPDHIGAVLEGHMTLRIAKRDRSLVDAFRKENRRRAPYDRNEILSAIAVLCFWPKEGSASLTGIQAKHEEIVVNLLVYHNAHAKHPVPPSAIARFGFPQFSFGSPLHAAVQAFA
ncbi:MAG: hypothetical protein OXI01_01010 [Albidovulum sp.]|nr:hypothetical protein [Albidovulum sp.]